MHCDVSVIIPTFNRLEFLKKSVAAVMGQISQPRELIVVDDGSTDATWAWLQSLAIPNLRIFRLENGGPARARNWGVSHAASKYLAFLDSDDYWLPEKLKVQFQFLEEHPEFKICQTQEIWLRNGVRVNSKLKHRKPSGSIFVACLKLCLISPSAVMMERELFESLGGFDPAFAVCEDYDLWLRASLKTPVWTLEKALTVKCGGHPDQLSKKHWGMDRFRVLALEKILAAGGLTRDQRLAALAVLRLKLAILSKGFLRRHPGKQDPYEGKLRWLQIEKCGAAADAPLTN